MANTSTPWTVRTAKRKSIGSAPIPRKRQRAFENVEDEPASIRRKPRQQTLTQIQFVPHRSQDDEADNLRPIATVPRRAPAMQNGVRLQKRNSTLTQMDFMASFAVDNDQEDGLTALRNDDDIKGDEGIIMQLDGTADAPNPRRKRDTPLTGRHESKRKVAPVFSEESQELVPTQKKRKTGSEVAADALKHGRRTSSRVASAKTTGSTGLLSAKFGDDHDNNLGRFESPSTRLNATTRRQPVQRALARERFWPASDKENQPPSQLEVPGISLPRTPSKQRIVIPSSQSPESLPPSTRRIKAPGAESQILEQQRSPLMERSVNAQVKGRRSDRKESPFNTLKGHSPLKRKICVLKLPSHTIQQQRASVGSDTAAPKHSIWSPPSSSPQVEDSGKTPLIPTLEIKDSTEVKGPALEVKDSVEEDEPEIPGTSPVNDRRGLASGQGDAETQETIPSLRGLLGLTDVPDRANALQETDEQHQPRQSGIAVKDFAVVENHWQAHQRQKAGLKQDEPPSGRSPGVASVADSEEEEGSVLALSPGSSIANDTQFNAELAERIPSSSADVSPSPSPSLKSTRRKSFSPSLQLDRDIELSLPRPNLAQQQGTYSTTKTVPLNNTSSPSLPSRSTQRTVYPASLPRPSQTSTQDPTQPYLPMSSMPLLSLSSPLRSGPATITIKDSSSVTGPLRDIPSQTRSKSQSQSQLNVDLGLDDCLDAEDDEDLDQELITMSDEVECAVDQEESQVMPPPLPLPNLHGRGQDSAKTKTKTTEAGSPVARRRLRKPVIPPEVRALLGESFLESVAGPPGWSQRSWDDEPL